MNTLKTILVTVDFSISSRAALIQAARLARLHGASLHVLHVVDSAAIDWIAVSRNVTREQLAAIEAGKTIQAKQARRVAIQDGATVDFLHVWHEPWLSMPYAFMAAEEAEFAQERQPVLRDTLKQFVSETAPDIESNEVLMNSPNYGNAITTYALEAKADLIVVGNKGRTNLRYVLLGSTAERLLSGLPCSLLVVKPTLESATA
jgi:nucleotide-binding universal stress UspA family protein